MRTKKQLKLAMPLLGLALVSILIIAACGGGGEPEARTFDLQIREGKLVAEPSSLQVKQGDEVTLRITSDKPAESVHLHGYDIELPMTEGEPTVMAFTADATGQFSIALHGYGGEHAKGEGELILGALVVQPR